MSNTLHQNEKFIIINTTVKCLKDNYKIENFSLNREPDEERIKEISKNFIANNVSFMTHFVCAWRSKLDTLEIYDGIHRVKACLDNNIDMNIILKIFLGTKEEALADFIDINKSIPVPSTYLNDLLEKSRKTIVIENVMKKICSKFQPCMSASRHPQKQNFNRDNFIEILTEIPEEYFEDINFENKLYTLMLSFNDRCRESVIESKFFITNKTHRNNFWINYLPSHKFVNYLLENLK